jgi:26S proteasome regulatory subunit N12
VVVENSNAAAEYLSPQGPAFIGPTPQRDGIVLGLFDSITEGTPSKRRIIFGEIEPNLFQTPTKQDRDAASEASSASRIRGERTPLSVTKRNLFDQFVTPKKRKAGEDGTPTSTLKGLATPAFLRRDNVLDSIDETDEATPRPAPWKKRGMVRSLSAMIQNMRKEEDDRLDEEADIMRELEMEEEGMRAPPKPRVSQVQVMDSQVEMPLGPDRGSESEEEDEEEEQLGPDGKPRRVWKKKGLKRQTRRTNCKCKMLAPILVHADTDQCDQTLPNQNLCQNSSTTTKSQRPSSTPKLYQRPRSKPTPGLHSRMSMTTLTMQAISLTQQRNREPLRRKQLRSLRRRRA